MSAVATARGSRMYNALEPWRRIFRHRSMLLQVTMNDIRGRFAGSVIGLAWMALYPLLFLGTYSTVFLFVLKVRLGVMTPLEYTALIFSGLVPFLAFNEGLGTGIGSVVANANLAKNTLFPIELVPVKAALMTQPTQLVGSAMLFAFLTATGLVNPWCLLFPVLWSLQMMFTIGVLWLLSALNVFVRDLQNIVAIVCLLLMMVTPVAYTVDMIPSALRPFLQINPLYYMIASYQDILVVGCFPRHGALAVFAAMSIGIFCFGHFVFIRLKTIFEDHL